MRLGIGLPLFVKQFFSIRVQRSLSVVGTSCQELEYTVICVRTFSQVTLESPTFSQVTLEFSHGSCLVRVS